MASERIEQAAGGQPGADERRPDRPAVGVRLLHAAATVPDYAHPGDAGADLTTVEDVTLAPGERRLVRTGLMIVLPEGYAGFVHPRSGLAARQGLTIVNTPGTIDAGYRGEILVCLLNTDTTHPIELHVGDRIAQLVVQRVEAARFPVLADGEDVPASTRGTGGYGSTGGFTGSDGSAGVIPTP